MTTYLIAHLPLRPSRRTPLHGWIGWDSDNCGIWGACPVGTQCAQASIEARSERSARARFAQRYPDRAITCVGIRGES